MAGGQATASRPHRRPAGRTQQGYTPQPEREAPGQVRPAPGSPPAPARAVPRRGGRTQQGDRQTARAGGRTQQATGNYRPGFGPPVTAPKPTGAAPRAPKPNDRGRAPSSRLAKVRRNGAGALLALFLYPPFLNLLKGGPEQMRGWFAAKWINQPYQPSSGKPGSSPVHGGHPRGHPGRRPKPGGPQ